jgi:hypothetical protein
LVLIVSAGLASVAFGLKQPQSRWEILTIACTVLAGIFFSLNAWYASPAGRLRWDGQFWRWSGFGDQTVCHLIVRIDWQSGILVTLNSQGQQRVWLWLDATSDADSWNGLRRAVFSENSNTVDEVQPRQMHGDTA